MKILNYLFACFLSILILSSCSEDLQEIIPDVDPVVFSGIEISQNFAFIEDVVSLNINASGYGEIEVTSNSSEIVSVTSVGDGIYEVSATEAVNVNIYVKLKDKNGDATGAFKTANVTFCEHGVKNFDTVEGIKIDRDRREKVISLLGEPDDIFVSSDSGYEYLYYLNLGVAFQLSNNIAASATLYSSNYTRTIDAVSVRYRDYPYELPYGWKIRQTTMDTVIETLGAPDVKSSSVDTTERILRSYRFDSLQSWIRFYSDNENEYSGETIRLMSIY